MTKLTTVVWDWNGTLLDDVQVSYRTVNRVLAQNGYAPIPDLETYRAKFCFPIIQYYRNVGFDFERTPFETVAQEYMDLYHPAAESCALQEGAEAALGALREAGQTCKVMVGGAVVTQAFADLIGADYYTKDAAQSAKVAGEVFGV